MFAALAVAAAAVAALAALTVLPLARWRRRRAALEQPLPAALLAIVDRNVPVRQEMPPDLRRRHAGLINAFLAEKHFVGCQGLAITAEIRATIAGWACLLLLGRPGSLYDELMSILVYPGAFWVEDELHDDDGLVTQRRRALSGEAWDAKRIILSWEDVREAAVLPSDGFNLVLHEFAHYLDAEGGSLAPTLPQAEHAHGGRASARGLNAWSTDLAEEFDRTLAAVERGALTFLDPYAAEDEAEFFAVATEEFYVRPRELRAAHQRLYRLLREFYGVDPAGWLNCR